MLQPTINKRNVGGKSLLLELAAPGKENLMRKISDAIIERLNRFGEEIAQYISNSNNRTFAQNACIALLALPCVLMLIVAIFTLVGKIFGSLLMKIITVPLMLFILGMSYKMNYGDSHRPKNESVELEAWAEEMYEYVQNALFLVFRSVSAYTNIVMPSRASAIECTDSPYSVEDGYTVFNFILKACGKIDTVQLKLDIQRTLRQMHRAHELNGIPRDLVEINGSYYCPLQILGEPRDYGDYIEVSVVFATEKTVALTHAHKLLNLDNVKSAHRHRTKMPYDDEL